MPPLPIHIPALLAMIALLVGCGQSSDDSVEAEPIVLTVADAEAISALRKQASDAGKVLVIDCWATWCSSCVAMFPHLHKAISERGDDVLLMSLSFDEGEDLVKAATQYLKEQQAMEGALLAEAGSDNRDLIAQALSETWDGGAIPAVFVYKPDGATAYEMLETRGEVSDWVAGIAAAVDESLQNAGGTPGQ